MTKKQLYVFLCSVFVFLYIFHCYLHADDKHSILSVNKKVFSNLQSLSNVPEGSQPVRLQRLKDWCIERNRTTSTRSRKRSLTRCWANNLRKVIFCFIPKVGCSMWKKVMMISTEKFGNRFPQWRNLSGITYEMFKEIGDPHHPRSKLSSYGLKQLGRYSLAEIQQNFHDFFKAMFVRDPYERLLSAYLNKIASAQGITFRNPFVAKLKRRYGKKVPDITNITFSDFISYVIHDFKTHSTNEHWTPCAQLIDPCILDFNFIGKIENMKQDASEILKHLFGKNFSLPVDNKSSTKSQGQNKEYYDTINEEQLQKIRHYFKNDFELFGYDPYKF